MSARDRLIAWLGEVHAVPPFDVGGLIRDVEKAAEERGRRKGVEERDKRIRAVYEMGYRDCERNRDRNPDRAIAPRDSAPHRTAALRRTAFRGFREAP